MFYNILRLLTEWEEWKKDKDFLAGFFQVSQMYYLTANFVDWAVFLNTCDFYRSLASLAGSLFGLVYINWLWSISSQVVYNKGRKQ